MNVFGVSRYLVAVFASYLLDVSSSPPEMSSDVVDYPRGMFTRGISSHRLRWMVSGSTGEIFSVKRSSSHEKNYSA